MIVILFQPSSMMWCLAVNGADIFNGNELKQEVQQPAGGIINLLKVGASSLKRPCQGTVFANWQHVKWRLLRSDAFIPPPPYRENMTMYFNSFLCCCRRHCDLAFGTFDDEAAPQILFFAITMYCVEYWCHSCRTSLIVFQVCWPNMSSQSVSRIQHRT